MTRLEEYKTALKKAVRLHYSRLAESVPDIYGYSLYTCDDLPGIGPVANRASAISVAPTDKMYNYYRYGAVEWSEFDDFGLFDDVNRIMRDIRNDEESQSFGSRREAILRATLETLCELRSDGLFGKPSNDRFLVICLADSDDPIMAESARVLNTPEVNAQYASAF